MNNEAAVDFISNKLSHMLYSKLKFRQLDDTKTATISWEFKSIQCNMQMSDIFICQINSIKPIEFQMHGVTTETRSRMYFYRFESQNINDVIKFFQTII